MVVARIETLKEAALHPEHGERARVTAQELIGSVRLLEEDEHVIAEQRAETWRRKSGHGVRDIGLTLGFDNGSIIVDERSTALGCKKRITTSLRFQSVDESNRRGAARWQVTCDRRCHYQQREPT